MSLDLGQILTGFLNPAAKALVARNSPGIISGAASELEQSPEYAQALAEARKAQILLYAFGASYVALFVFYFVPRFQNPMKAFKK